MPDARDELLSQFGDVLPEAFWATDLTANRMIHVSPGFEDIWGIPVQAFYDDPLVWMSIVHPDDKERVTEEILRSGLKEHDIEYRVVRSDGVERWVRSRGFVLSDRQGKPYRLIGLSLDITAQKETEAALRAALDLQASSDEQLEELGRLKEEVLRRVSHEIRTPLTAILGFSELLDQGDFDPRHTTDMIHMIAQNAARLQDMLSDLLDLDQLHRGVVEAKPRVTEVRGLLLNVIDKMDLYRARPLLVDLERVVCMIDPSHLGRMVEGLLANAVRHTPAGTPIEIHATQSGSDLVVRIEDAGPGIPPEIRETLFEPFAAHSPGSDYSPGLGVGLDLVRSLVELSGGTIDVRARQERGTVFEIILGDVVAAPDAIPADDPSSTSVILVIDDDAQHRDLTARVLERSGLQASTAASAHEGLTLARSLLPRLIILDVNPPGSDGIDVLVRLRADGRTASIPVMLLTGAGRPMMKAQHLLLGADDFMIKPYEERELLERVRAVLARVAGPGRAS